MFINQLLGLWAIQVDGEPVLSKSEPYSALGLGRCSRVLFPMDSPPTPNCLRFPQCQFIKLSPPQGGGRSVKTTRTSTSPRRSFLHKTFSATIQLPPTSCNSRPSQITLASARDSTTHIPRRSPVYRLDVVERRGLRAILVPSRGFWSTDPSVEPVSSVQINGRR